MRLILTLLLCCAPLIGQVSLGGGKITGLDEGTSQGTFGRINFIGAGITCTDSSGTFECTVGGGAAPVDSVFGRTGTVVAAEADYTMELIGDVDLTTPANNHGLQYNGTNWINVSAFANALISQTAVTQHEAALNISNMTGLLGDAQLANNYSGVGACAANNAVTALNDNATPTCSQFSALGQTIEGTEITNETITASDIDETVAYAFEVLPGKQLRSSISVDDDDCTGEQGKWWYDTTDSKFEFCDANSGTPTVITAGSGDVTGPASATDNAFSRFDGTTGKTIQNGQTTEDDSGNVTVAGNLNIGDGTAAPVSEYKELTANGSESFKVTGDPSQSASGCVVLPDDGTPANGEALVATATTQVIDGSTCRELDSVGVVADGDAAGGSLAGSYPNPVLGADAMDAMTEIATSMKSRADDTDTKLVTTSVSPPGGNRCTEMDTNGSLVLAGDTCSNLGGGSGKHWMTVYFHGLTSSNADFQNLVQCNLSGQAGFEYQTSFNEASDTTVKCRVFTPPSWSAGTVAFYLFAKETNSGTASNIARFRIATGCKGDGEVVAEGGTPFTMNTEQTIDITASGTDNTQQIASIASLTMTGCAGAEWMAVDVRRDGDEAADTANNNWGVTGFGLEFSL